MEILILRIFVITMVLQRSISYVFRLPKIQSKRFTSHFFATKQDYVQLGSSDLKVSKICLGTMTWGQQNTEDEGIAQLDYAFENGINFIDTAEMYPVPTKPDTQGRTDRTIGKWLRTKDRSKVILATKVAGRSDHITWLPGRNGGGSRLSREQILLSVEESLKRLQTDYIDVIQIHWPDRYVPLFGQPNYELSKERKETVSFEEQLLAFDSLIKQGKVRYLGLSNETPYGIMKFNQVTEKLGLQTKIISLQNSYSLLVRLDVETNLVEVCSPNHENIGILAYSPLAGGSLSGKYSKPNVPKNSRFLLFPSYMERYTRLKTKEVIEQYAGIAAKYGLTPTELSLIWCYTRPFIASTIIGATNMNQLKENIEAYAKISIFTNTPEIVQEIQEVHRLNRDPTKDV